MNIFNFLRVNLKAENVRSKCRRGAGTIFFLEGKMLICLVTAKFRGGGTGIPIPLRQKVAPPRLPRPWGGGGASRTLYKLTVLHLPAT